MEKHVRKHNATVIHLWNSDWYHDDSISRFALKFSRLNKIVSSDQWANLTEENGIDGNNWGYERDQKIIDKQKKTINCTEWKETIGKESRRKRLETINDPLWKETVGKEGYKKVSDKLKGKRKPWVSDWQKKRHESIRNLEIINPNSKRWKVIEPNGNIVIVDNLPLFCKEHNISQGNLSRGKTKGYSATCLGYLRDLKVTDICD